MAWFEAPAAAGKTGTRLVWLTIGAFVLWPLGTGLGFLVGHGFGEALSKTLALPCFLLLVITIKHLNRFIPARQMWRLFRSRRTGEDGASPAVGIFGDLLLMLLCCLFWVPMCLFLGLSLTADVPGDLQSNRLVGRLLFVTSLTGGALLSLYSLIIVPLRLVLDSAKRRKRERTEAELRGKQSAVFTELLVRILVAIARADGHFTRAELAVILDFFRDELGYDAARLGRVKRLVRHALDYPKDIDKLLATLVASFPYSAHLITMELVFRLVHTKNPPLPAELRLARDIAAALEIRPADLKNIEAKYRDRAEAEAESARERREREQKEREQREERARRDQEEARRRAERQRRAQFSARDEQAFAILGMEPVAKFAAIKKAYRKLVTQYHPDKVGHLGEEYRRIATEKTKELNAAYRHLAERFGK